MEHVGFLIEESGLPVRCQLNPETLVIRRLAGVRTRPPAAGRPAGPGLLDDPVFFTGGGRTELDLDLLFDTELNTGSLSSTPAPQDVRELTRQFWQLAENSARSQEASRPPQVRFLWGKAWNIPGVVLAIAERFESFTPDGIPRRSWLRMRLLRVNEAPRREPGAARPVAQAIPEGKGALIPPGEPSRIYQPLGLGEPGAAPPAEGLFDPASPGALLTQALENHPDARQALRETGQAVEALAAILAEEALPGEAGAVLFKAVNEMQSALQSVAPGAGLPSLPAAVIQMGAAQAAALAGLPPDGPVTGASRAALSSLEPLLSQLGQAQAEIAVEVEAESARVTAGAAGEIAAQAAVLEGILPGEPVTFQASEEESGSATGPVDGVTDPGEEISPEAAPTETGEAELLHEGEPLPEGERDTPQPEAPAAPAVEAGEEVVLPEGEPEPGDENGDQPGEAEAAQAKPVGWQDLFSDIQKMAASAEAILTQGFGAGIDEIQEALDNLGPQLSADLAEITSRPVRQALQSLADASHQLRSAEAARQAVSPATLLSRELVLLRAALEGTSAQLEDVGSKIEEGLRRLEALACHVFETAALKLSAPSGAPEGVPEGAAIQQAAAQVRQELQRVGAPENRPAAIASIQKGLAPLDALVERRWAAEAEQAARATRAAATKAVMEQAAGLERPAAAKPIPQAASLPDEWYSPVERLDQIAYRFYGSPACWRLLAQANHIDNPLQLAPGQPLVIPPKPGA